MSRSRSDTTSDRPAGPQTALDALLDDANGDPGQARLLQRALWLETLDRQLRSCLPPALAPHARLANVERGRLVYLVDAPVWHTRLRLAATDILHIAQSLGLEATDLVVRTAKGPLFARPQDSDSPTTKTPPLSAAARDAFAAALSVQGDPPPEDIS